MIWWASTAAAEVAVSVWLDGAPTAAGGALVVAVRAPESGELSLPVPVVEGLEFHAAAAPRVEDLGLEQLVTVRYTFTGRTGSYEIPALSSTWAPADGPAEHGVSVPLWVDLGVEPPRPGEPHDIVEPRDRSVWPWVAAGAVVCALGMMGAGVWFAFRPRPVRSAPPPDPADVIALRAWAAVRSDPQLDAHGKALALSRLFREYLEAALVFPATAWTTTETVDHLVALVHLPEGNVGRARRLLRATDRVKYADARASESLFDELDGDLRGFVGDTRPRRVDG